MNSDLLIGDGVLLVPYAEVDGAWTLPDQMVADTWQRMDDENAREILFNGAEVAPGAFLPFAKDPSRLLVFYFRPGGAQPVGVGWLNGIHRNYATAHFFILREAWGRDAFNIGMASTRYWLSMDTGDGPLFDVLIGNIASSNKRAVRFVQRLGWTVLGEIPHMAHGESMTISYAERGNGTF